MEATDSFGYWVRRRRKALDLTQRELATRVGCATTTIKKIEHDQRRPSRPMAERLAECLGVPVEERAAFVRSARGLRAAARLPMGTEPLPKAVPGPGNLPAPLTSFIDRSVEVSRVTALLERPDVRLLTLVGPPGVGKTRLGIQTAEALADRFPDGAWFVSLAPITDPALVPSAIAQTLSLPTPGAGSEIERLKDRLRERRLLLVLDNFEHLLPAGPVVTDLLRACRQVKALVTSRAALLVGGEHEYPVPPFALPSSIHYRDIVANDAVRLFTIRAQAFDLDFRLTPANATTVAEICTRLDGLPLAIELAAARLRYASLDDLVRQLQGQDEDRGGYLGALVHGPRDAAARQQTLQDAIAWSYQLLGDAERVAFQQIAVFQDGCSAEAFEAVCGASIEAVERLITYSLVHRTRDDAGGTRYSMLVPIREFALAELAARDPEGQVRRAHAAFYSALVAEARQHFYSPHQLRWLQAVALERDNVRAALAWYRHQDPTAGLALAANLWPFWYLWGQYDEGTNWLEGMLGRATQSTIDRATALLGMGTLIQRQRRYADATPPLEAAVGLYRELGDSRGTASAKQRLAENYAGQGLRDRAEVLTQEALELFREADDPLGLSWSLSSLASHARMRGDYVGSRALMEQSLQAGRTAGDRRHLAWMLSLAVNTARALRDLPAMQTYAEEALTLFQQVHDRPGEAYARYLAGQRARMAGDRTCALQALTAALAIAQEVGNYEDFCLVELAMLFIERGEFVRGVRLAGLTLALAPNLHARLGPDERVDWRERLDRARAALGDAAYARAWAAGRMTSMTDVLAELRHGPNYLPGS